MCRKLICLVSFVLVFALAGSATANKQWTGDGGDNYWSNPANWSGDGGFYIVDLDNATVLIDSGDQTAENQESARRSPRGQVLCARTELDGWWDWSGKSLLRPNYSLAPCLRNSSTISV